MLHQMQCNAGGTEGTLLLISSQSDIFPTDVLAILISDLLHIEKKREIQLEANDVVEPDQLHFLISILILLTMTIIVILEMTIIIFIIQVPSASSLKAGSSDSIPIFVAVVAASDHSCNRNWGLSLIFLPCVSKTIYY